MICFFIHNGGAAYAAVNAVVYRYRVRILPPLWAREKFLSVFSAIPFIPHSRARCNEPRSSANTVDTGPSPRTLVRVATAYMHKMFGTCTDYYVHLNLVECERRPSGLGSYSHSLDFGAGSRPSYWCEAAIRNMFASALHIRSRNLQRLDW